MLYADGYAAAMSATKEIMTRYREKLCDAESIKIFDQMDEEIRQALKIASEQKTMRVGAHAS